MANLDPLMTSDRDDWLTPEDIVKRICGFNGGEPDFDPCGNPANCFAATTVLHPMYRGKIGTSPNIIFDDGLGLDWAKRGLVYCNPPYGRQIGYWLAKARTADEFIGLPPARPDTRWFHDHVWCSDVVIFIEGRLHFSGHKHAAPFPSVLYYWGDRIDRFVHYFGDLGKVLIQP